MVKRNNFIVLLISSLLVNNVGSAHHVGGTNTVETNGDILVLLLFLVAEIEVVVVTVLYSRLFMHRLSKRGIFLVNNKHRLLVADLLLEVCFNGLFVDVVKLSRVFAVKEDGIRLVKVLVRVLLHHHEALVYLV